METEGRSSFSDTNLLQEGSVLILVSLIIIPHMRAIVEAMVGIIAQYQETCFPNLSNSSFPPYLP